jgi:coenzyme PQQ precursor peptide PqqA
MTVACCNRCFTLLHGARFSETRTVRTPPQKSAEEPRFFGSVERAPRRGSGTIPALVGWIGLGPRQLAGLAPRWFEQERKEVRRMVWETPEFVEVRMDAEVTAYQGDFGD